MQLDFTNETPESLDEGGRISQAGWYLTNLKDTYIDDESSEQVFEFLVTSGAFKGTIQFVRLKNPDLADNPDTSAKRSMKWAGRLGIAPIGRAVTWEELPWIDAIAKPFVLELEDDTYVAKSGAKAGQTVHSVRPTYLGVYPLDSDKIPGEVRAALGLPPSKNGTPASTKAGGAGTTVAHTPGPVSHKAGKDGAAAATAVTSATASSKPAVDVSNL